MIEYRKNILYRFNVKSDGQLYTGKVIEQDNLQIKIETIKNEVLMLPRSDIRAKELTEKVYKDDKNEFAKETKRD